MSKQETFQDLSIEYEFDASSGVEILSIMTLSGRDVTEKISDEWYKELEKDIVDYEMTRCIV
jgi:hypothetical protein